MTKKDQQKPRPEKPLPKKGAPAPDRKTRDMQPKPDRRGSYETR